MIEPLARGVDPVQLAFQSLASMGARTERTPSASPLAVALDRLGVDLAHGERFTTAEAREFVSLVRTTLEVLEAAPAVEQAARSGAPLVTVQYAMRDLQRALTQVLTAHHDFTTTLAPILREVLVAMQEIATMPPGPRPTVPASLEEARVPAEGNRVIVGDGSPPPLARLVSSLVASIARLQAVLPLQAAPGADPAPGPAGALDLTSVNGTQPNVNVRGDTSTGQVDRTNAPLSDGLSQDGPLPAPTIRLLQRLVTAIAELLTLLPLAATSEPLGPESASHPLQNLARALGEATVLLEHVLAEPAAQTTTGSGPIEPSQVPRTANGVPGSAQLSVLPTATLGAEAARVIGLVHELLTAPTAAPLPRPVAEASQPVAAGAVEVPTLPQMQLAELPAPLVASLAEVITNLQAAVPAALLEAGLADESAPLMTAIQLAQLQAAARPDAVAAGSQGMPINPLETLDAYRWGLLVALNYRPAVGRPTQARVSLTRPRCEICNRLLEQTRSGALVCPTC